MDVIIKISNNIIELDWYHKDYYSGRYLSFFLDHSVCHKIDVCLAGPPPYLNKI